MGGGKLRAIRTGNTYTSGYIVPVNEWTHVAFHGAHQLPDTL